MKKKFLSIFILFFMFFSLVSCGSHGVPGGGENGDNNVVDTSNTNKIIYNVGYKLYSDNIGDYISKINNWVREDNGYISESNQENLDYAYYVYRIPTDKLNGFLDKIDSLEGVNNKTVSTRDVTSTYNELEASIELLESRKTSYLNLLNSGTLTKTEVIEINQALDDVEIKLISAYKELAQLANRVDYSTVTISYYKNSNTETYQYFVSYGGYLISICTTIGSIVLYSLPFLLVAGIVVLVIIVVKKKKTE